MYTTILPSGSLMKLSLCQLLHCMDSILCLSASKCEIISDKEEKGSLPPTIPRLQDENSMH